MAMFIFGVVGIEQPTALSALGLLEAHNEARLVQLASALLVAMSLSMCIIIVLGLQGMVWHAMDSAKTVLAPLAACSAFMIVGPMLTLLNKYIMQDLSFPYPLTLSCVGLISSSVFSFILVFFGLANLRPETQAVLAGRGYCRIVLPMAATRAVSLATGNWVYLILSVGFIQMLKAFTPAIVLVVMVLAQVELPTSPSIWCVMVIVIGTVVEINGELQASFAGVLLMVISCFGDAISTVLSQKMLQDMKFSTVEALYYLSLPSGIMLGSLAVIWEWGTIFKAGHHALFVEFPLVWLAAVGLGITVNFLALAVVRSTSSVTVKILNTVRCIGLVFVGMLLYGEKYTTRQLAGYAVSLVGFAGYNYFQRNYDKARACEAQLGLCWQTVVPHFGGQMHATDSSKTGHSLTACTE